MIEWVKGLSVLGRLWEVGFAMPPLVSYFRPRTYCIVRAETIQSSDEIRNVPGAGTEYFSGRGARRGWGTRFDPVTPENFPDLYYKP